MITNTLNGFLRLNQGFAKVTRTSIELEQKRDSYDCLFIKLKQKVKRDSLVEYLQQLEKVEKQRNSNAMWVIVNEVNLEHLGALVSSVGYKIHHGLDQKVFLYKWISEKADLVPPYSAFYVSCGAVLVHDDHILLIQEKNGPRKGCFGIPGGRSDKEEFISQSVERQLFEETGIRSKFKYILSLRQMEKTVFGANDLYFSCVVEADRQSLSHIKLCEREIMSHKWVHLSETQSFLKKQSIGSQTKLGAYITELYRKGFDFLSPENIPNTYLDQIFRRKPGDEGKRMIEHRLVPTAKDKVI